MSARRTHANAFGGALNAGPDFLSLFQEKDLKQYMDDCGNIMSVHNVKVKPGFFSQSICFTRLSKPVFTGDLSHI